MVKKRIILIIITAVLITAAAVFIIFRDSFFGNAPEQVTITVAWNPGSISDDLVRVIASGTDTQINLQNITGANGANGLNAVYNAERDGRTLLSTSLSAFMAAEEMGFAESSPGDWTGWLLAFSPFMTVVAADSPYMNADELHGLMQADISLGSGPAVNAVLSGEAGYAVLLSVEVAARLRSGELRVLETAETGEYYGLFIPAATSESKLRGLDKLIEAAAASEAFAVFLNEKELSAPDYSRKQSEEVIRSYKT
jgi:tripartite-type tricarboxylate transporter receptor subunit TctC